MTEEMHDFILLIPSKSPLWTEYYVFCFSKAPEKGCLDTPLAFCVGHFPVNIQILWIFYSLKWLGIFKIIKCWFICLNSSPSIHLFPPTFYQEKQEEIGLYLQHSVWKAPRLISKVMTDRYSLRTLFSVASYHCVTRLSFPPVSNHTSFVSAWALTGSSFNICVSTNSLSMTINIFRGTL